MAKKTTKKEPKLKFQKIVIRNDEYIQKLTEDLSPHYTMDISNSKIWISAAQDALKYHQLVKEHNELQTQMRLLKDNLNSLFYHQHRVDELTEEVKRKLDIDE